MLFRIPSMRLITALCCLVVLSLVAGLGAADPGVAIEDGPSNETLGDVVEFTVSVPGNGTATVLIEGTDGTAYAQVVRLDDTSGDGTITLRINSFHGKQTAVYAVGDGDTVTVGHTAGTTMPAGSYDVRLFGGATADGAPVTVTTFDLAAPTEGTGSYSVAGPNTTDRLDTRRDIERARNEGWLADIEDDEEVAAGDTLVLSLRVDGIEGAVAAAPGADDTEQFTAMLDRENTSLRLEMLPGIHYERYWKRLNRSNVAAVVGDTRNDTYHVVLDTVDAGITPATSGPIEEGDELDLHLTVAGDKRVADDSGFAINEPEAEILTDVRATHDADTATVRGETNLAPGSEVVVRLAANGTTVASASGTVGPERRFAVRLAVAGARQADSTTLTVLHDGAAIETISDRTALSVPRNQSIADGELRVPSVWLPADGYVHIVGPDGTVVGRSDELERERSHDVTIPLSITEVGPDESLTVVPVSNDSIDPGAVSYDSAVLVDAPPAGVAVNVTTLIETEQATPNETTRARRPGATPRETSTSATTTAADGPGFGTLSTVLAVSLVALATRYR